MNGRVVGLGTRADPEQDHIAVKGRGVVARRPPVTLALYKPERVLTTKQDPAGRPTVMNLVPSRFRHLNPVGRLDYLTDGLLLLTSDGELANQLTHPRYKLPKVYQAKVKGRPSDAAVQRLARGVPLDGRRTLPAQIRLLRGKINTWWQVTLREGRSRQIRRLFESIGHPVLKLRRVAIGPLTIQGLEIGKFRLLTAEEVEVLRGAAASLPDPEPQDEA